ncbi:MAG: radical SAM protein [Oscillospiraceae bacterium]|jgi:nitrogenase cofactor biosynthesis protein NifB|nr:radical SAM protein [Oscillospiraceae bacterium]
MLSPIERETSEHPCYSCGARGSARIHLPVAPRCNIQCRYCLRKYDCPNESRPGVSSQVLTPRQAFEKYVYAKRRIPNLKVAGIAGPGDALANFAETAETMRRIRACDPEVTLCLSTNGLALPDCADRLSALGVHHLTVTVNAVDPNIGAGIYQWVDCGGARRTGVEAAKRLLENQMEGLQRAVQNGMICKVNCVALPGVNVEHIPQVARQVAGLGAYMMNIMPCIAVAGTEFAEGPVLGHEALEAVRAESGRYIKQMRHCRQCRADALGTLTHDQSLAYREIGQTAGGPAAPAKKRYAEVG